MLVETKHFGTIEIDDEKIITFKNGLFGFAENKKFTIIYDEESSESPFCWLQSIGNKGVILPAISPLLLFPEYSPEISDELISSIGELKAEDLMLLTIVVVPEKIENMTTNLKAPIIINTKTRNGIQVIVENNEYEIKQNLYDRIKMLNERTGD